MKSPSQSDPWIGKLIGDRQRYRLDERLGSGGTGEVFLAMDTLLGQKVALKLLNDTLLTSEETRKRFESEVAVCAALKNEHIVQISDYGVSTEGYPFYVMEYLHGQSLGQLMRSEGQLSVLRILSIMTQVCDGLRLAHQGVTLWRNNASAHVNVKVVHRNLNPDNIYLVPTSLGELVKILDFGIAKIREGTTEHTQLTKMFVGNYHYASPEQLEVNTDIDGRADIYSLGMIFYEMLSGTDPFGLGLSTHKISEISWAMAHTATPPQSLRQYPHLSGLQPELETVVMRCLEKTPAQRFASVDELKQAMLAAVAVKPHSQPSPTTTSTPGSSEPTIPRLSPQQPAIPNTIVQGSPPPKQGVPNTIVQGSPPPKQGVPNTIVQGSPPPKQGVPNTIVQGSPPPKQGVPGATIAQSQTPPKHTSRRFSPYMLLVLGIGVAIITGGVIFAYIQLQPRQQNNSSPKP